MKKLILSAALMVAAVGAFAQGQVYFDNGTPSNLTPSATSGGAFFLSSGGTTTILTDQVNLYYGSLLGGPTAGSLVPLVQDTLMDYAGTPGEYLDDSGNPYTIAGVPGPGPAFFQVQIWQGNYASLAAAQAAGSPNGTSAVFSNPLGNFGIPANLPATLSGMPAVILTVPEPGTLALAGLGAAALLIFRRRK